MVSGQQVKVVGIIHSNIQHYSNIHSDVLFPAEMVDMFRGTA